MEVKIIKIDGALTYGEMDFDRDVLSFREDEKSEYKYLAFLPIGENGLTFPCASKDLEHWRICVHVWIDGIGRNPVELEKEL